MLIFPLWVPRELCELPDIEIGPLTPHSDINVHLRWLVAHDLSAALQRPQLVQILLLEIAPRQGYAQRADRVLSESLLSRLLLY